MNNPIHPKHGIPVPLTLVCTVTGKVTKYTAPEYIRAKIAEAGSLEALLSNYVCKGARKKVSGGAIGAGASKSGRTWKKEAIIKEDKPIVKKQAESKESVEMVHYVYKMDGDVECNVYAPRANKDQPLNQTFDFRKKKNK